MKQSSNSFRYRISRGLEQISLLDACMDDFSYRPHAHEEFCFGYTQSGQQVFFADGEHHRSQAGQVIIFNPDVVHDGHSGSASTLLRYRMLYIHPRLLEPMFACAGIKSSRSFRIDHIVTHDPLLLRRIEELSWTINQPQSERLSQECALFSLALRIAQTHGDAFPSNPSGRTDALIKRAQCYIQDHLDRQLSLDEISRQANLSKYHFLRLFRQQIGMTPHQYVINCRLSQARNDLAAGDGVENIVYRWGFSDLSHLNRLFKASFGMTPYQYQQRLITK